MTTLPPEHNTSGRHRDSTLLLQELSDHKSHHFNATCSPIYQTATFEQEAATAFGRFDYTRSGNPTREALECQIAQLEVSGTGIAARPRSFAFASGLAAIGAVFHLLAPGDEVLACDDLYGGTYRFFSQILARRGVKVTYADLTDLATVRAHLSPKVKIVYFESVSNPLMHVCDIRAISQLAHRMGARVCIDNTFLSPVLQKPLALGADYVVHSATKYLCGHSDVTAGVVTVTDAELAKELYLVQNGEGAGLGPQDCYLLMRGLKTLDLRLERQQRNANVIAMYLMGKSGVTKVRFPGLPGQTNSHIHASQASGTGAVVCFETGDPEYSKAIVEALTLFGIRVSFGSVSSSASMPCYMSHASIPTEVKSARNFPTDIVRLSIGVEDVRDLIADLDNAFATAQSAHNAIVVTLSSPQCCPVGAATSLAQS
jgi:cystathionine beta-lyase